MSRSLCLSDFQRIKIANNFEELVSTPFENGINALCWERELPGNFAEVVERLCEGIGLEVGITPLDEERLQQLAEGEHLSEDGRTAVAVMLEDLRRLRECGLDPQLDAVNGYKPVEEPGPVRTDVCSFHADSATVEADTWLCTYHGASSEGLQNEEALQRIEVPGTRAALLKYYRETEERPEAQDDEVFREWLNECCYDLHYVPKAEAKPYSFGIGNLWRIATEWPGCAVPPCIHRAPDPVAGGVRLLLIS